MSFRAPDRPSPLSHRAPERSSPLSLRAPDRSSPSSLRVPDRSSPLLLRAPYRSSPLSLRALERSSPLSLRAPDRPSPLSLGAQERSSPLSLRAPIDPVRCQSCSPAFCSNEGQFKDRNISPTIEVSVGVMTGNRPDCSHWTVPCLATFLRFTNQTETPAAPTNAAVC